MLVLTRKNGQGIKIAEGTIEIKVIKTRQGSVRIAIDAPDDVDIVRSELEPRETVPGITPAKVST